jgi:hypothetical protein
MKNSPGRLAPNAAHSLLEDAAGVNARLVSRSWMT